MFLFHSHFYSYFSLQLLDREAVDFIENSTDLMNLGKDTGRLDGRISSSSNEKNNNNHDDNVDDNNDNNENDNDDDEKDKSNGKRLRMSLQKGEVKQNILLFSPYMIVHNFLLSLCQ